MKPVIKKTITIVSAVVAALLITVLVLSLVVIKPIESLGKYESAYVLESYNRRLNNNKEALDKSLGSIKFSIMRSLLEFQTDYNIKPVTVKDADGETVKKKYTVESFADIRPGEGQYMIELYYGEKQTNKYLTDDDCNKIPYDTVILIIGESENTIHDVKLYPYLKANMENEIDRDTPDENGIIGSKYYFVYEFTAKMYTYDFYETIKDYYDPSTGNMYS